MVNREIIMQKIFLPGWGISEENYLDFIKKENFDKVFNYGFFNENTNSFDNIIETIEILLNKNTIIYAHSMGSLLALNLASKFNTVKKLNLYSPFAKFAEDIDYKGQPILNIISMQKQLKTKPNKLLKSFYRSVCSPGKNNLTMPDKFNIQNLNEGLKLLKLKDYRDLLNDIKIPVNLIQGEDDSISNMELAIFMDNKLRNSQLTIIENKGHWLF